MIFYSTNHQSQTVNLEQAVMNGLAPDGGLYMPEYIPILSQQQIDNCKDKNFVEIAQLICKEFIGSEIPEAKIYEILIAAYDFPIPLVKLNNRCYSFELFHGPTLAFKDFAARFMARLMAHFISKTQQKITILVATSGDTGGAVAHGFLGVSNINVVILYPSKKVSYLQEQQLTTMGQNIHAIEVNGSFDDCQKLIKQAFMDKDLNKLLNLASANSINIARLLPQIFYYAYLSSKLIIENKKLVVSVPSGNFGNLTAGIIAKKMGFPIDYFIAATNINNTVPQYLTTGTYLAKSSISTISNAMDVGNPSNFVRMLEIYNNQVKQMGSEIYGTSFTDEQTKQIMLKLYNDNGYILDPHGAVAYLGLNEYLNKNPDSIGAFIETAHPAKFIDVVEDILKIKIDIPERLAIYAKRKKQADYIENNFEELKQFLLKK